MKKLILVLSILISSSAFAGSWYFFQPGIGYYQGHYQTNKITGLGLNIKLGFNWDKVFIGGDIDYAQKLNGDALPDINIQNTSVVFGYNAGAFRAWYGMMTGASIDYKSGANEVEVTGTGTKLGLGVKTGGNTYLNLEASFIKYDEASTNGTPADVDQFMDIVLLSFSVLI